jgi:type IV secretion system protein VirD4
MKRPFELFIFLGLGFAYLTGLGIAYYYGYDGILQYLSNVRMGGFDFWLMIVSMAAVVLIFIVLSDEKIKSNYGDARWAKTKDIKKMKLFAKKGPILGLWNGKYIRYDKPLSTLIAAPPGTGKTAMIAVPTLLSCSYSMVINDVKGELWKLTSKHRAKYQKVFRFAPSEEGSAKWNVFDEMPTDSLGSKMKFINRVARILYPLSGNSNDKDHWPRGAQAIFTFFAIIATIKNDNNLSLSSIRAEILQTDDIQEYVAKYMDNEYQARIDLVQDEYIMESANRILQINAEEFSSMVSTTTAALDALQNPITKNNTNSSDFSISDLRDENNKISIYLCSKAEDFDMDQPLLRLFLDLAGMRILSDEDPKDNQMVCFLLDEFVRMGRLDNLMQLPAVSRGQKAFAIFIVQDYAQLRRVYGDNGINELMTTTAYKVVFQQNNDQAQDRISKLIGKKTVKRESISKRMGLTHASKDRSISEEGVPLILPQDIGTLTDDQVIIISQGHNTKPIMAKTCKYFKIRAMKKLVA